MIYENIKCGSFICRPNRFIAKVNIEGKEETVHVKNTGRCKELLTRGARVILQYSDSPKRKTAWDLISVYKGERLINMDSQAPNKVFYEFLSKGVLFESPEHIKPECKYGNSRFDFFVKAQENDAFIEVKGVTLEEDGAVLFPDAPTERGVKHIKELIKAREDGFEAYIAFIVQTENVRYFTPNAKTHPEFADALREAAAKGVKILCYDCKVTESSLTVNMPVEVRL